MHRKTLAIGCALAFALLMGGNLLAQEEIKLGGRKIVGGEPTDIEHHPWQVALNINRPDGTYLCGGSIIAEKWILTAAHCFRPSDAPNKIRTKAGSTYINQGGWSEVETVVVHQSYNPRTYENDIALVKLKEKADGRVIPLAPSGTKIPINEPLEVTGWGATTETGTFPNQLLKATVPYVDNTTCNQADSYNGEIRSKMMCAGHRSGGIDSCKGDSGGPLVWRTSNGPILVGVVSFGHGCARALKYGVYTRVSAYRDWINSKMRADKN